MVGRRLRRWTLDGVPQRIFSRLGAHATEASGATATAPRASVVKNEALIHARNGRSLTFFQPGRPDDSTKKSVRWGSPHRIPPYHLSPVTCHFSLAPEKVPDTNGMKVSNPL